MVGYAAVGDPAGDERHGAHRCHRPEQREDPRQCGGYDPKVAATVTARETLGQHLPLQFYELC